MSDTGYIGSLPHRRRGFTALRELKGPKRGCGPVQLTRVSSLQVAAHATCNTVMQTDQPLAGQTPGLHTRAAKPRPSPASSEPNAPAHREYLQFYFLHMNQQAGLCSSTVTGRWHQTSFGSVLSALRTPPVQPSARVWKHWFGQISRGLRQKFIEDYISHKARGAWVPSLQRGFLFI